MKKMFDFYWPKKGPLTLYLTICETIGLGLELVFYGKRRGPQKHWRLSYADLSIRLPFVRFGIDYQN